MYLVKTREIFQTSLSYTIIWYNIKNIIKLKSLSIQHQIKYNPKLEATFNRQIYKITYQSNNYKII